MATGKESRWTAFLGEGGISNMVKGASAQTLATSVAGQALILVSGIIAARALGVEGRGILAYLWLIPLTLVLLGGIGVPQATTFYVARELGNAAAVVRISIRITLGLAVLLATAYAAGLLLIAGPSASFSAADGVLSVLLVPTFLAQNLGIAVLLGMKRYRAFNMGRIIPALLYAAGTAVLFALNRATLFSILAASVSSWGISALVTWALVFRDLPASGRPTGATPRKILSFGLRGVIGSVSPVDDVRVDQLLVGFLMDARALGLYVSAVAFCNLPRFIAYSIGSVSFPRIASAENRTAAWAIAQRAFRIGLAVVTACVVALLVVLPFLLPLLFGEDFREAIGLGRILLVAAFFLAMHRLLTELARGLGHPGYGSITELVNLSVFVLGVLVFAIPATANGIATAVVAGGFASSALLFFLLVRLGSKQRDL